ncbi:ABC transporter permease [Bacillus sp. 2205SS5-2]|uniref:ABC transporter permease n=1 Tax=Bacillus sp. 2205SS5-2 TaxID=3109031 RepID=UPI003004FFE7
MRILAFVKRIMLQLFRDKRTLALMFLAPLFILTLLWLIFDADPYTASIGVVADSSIQEQFETKGAQAVSESEAYALIETGELDGFILLTGTPTVVVEGSDPSVTKAVMKDVQEWFAKEETSLQMEYVHGNEEMAMFDSFGPILLGFFVFFFVFLVSGVSFLRERTSGTLERLLASPLKIWEMVLGYIAGFGIFTMIQAAIISFFSIYVLDMLMVGNVSLVLTVIVLLSFSALTLGILLSAFAKNELQMMQFIPLVVVPQIFFSGLFNLETISEWLSWIGPITPLYYAGSALRDVMLRGAEISDLTGDLLALLLFSFVFILLNIAALKKYRKI